MQKPSLLLFNDLIEAFGQVVRKWLFESIYQRFPQDIEPKLFRLLVSLYSKTTTSLAQNPDDIFELLLEVRQDILIKNGRFWSLYPPIFCIGLSNTIEL